MTDLGNWSRPGVPHKGWTCTGIIDVGDDLITCQMCEFADVRYVHEMEHPDWPDGLWVGCYCAGRMEENYEDAKKREAEFKGRERNPQRAAYERWAVAADELLRCPELDPREWDFVYSMRARMAWSAKPRTKKYQLSEKQANWFVALYKRYVEPRKEGVE